MPAPHRLRPVPVGEGQACLDMGLAVNVEGEGGQGHLALDFDVKGRTRDLVVEVEGEGQAGGLVMDVGVRDGNRT